MAYFEIINVSKSFNNKKILKDINLKINEGEVVSIIGSSGSGKTTLLKIINLLEKSDSGIIKINDQIMDKNSSFVGMVFQQYNLFPHLTVLKNVTLALKLKAKREKNYNKKTKEKIENLAIDLLKQVNLFNKINEYPGNLSGGEQQRVAIARCLAMSPGIICFDEPTSALDPELTKEVLNTIKKLKNFNKTMIIVTHEIDFAKEISDRILFMCEGIIELNGSVNEVFTSKNEKFEQFLAN